MIINNAPVTVQEISSVNEHPNADRLELATVGELQYQFVVGKGQFVIGDKVVYIPVDSVLPDDVIEIAGLTGKLSGANKNRVKTIKLRGQVSQGLVLPVDALPHISHIEDLHVGLEVHELLGIQKHEPPMPVIKNGNLHPLPNIVGRYSLANGQQYPELIKLLMDEPVFITEKAEGSNWWAHWDVDQGKFSVGQRNFEIVPKDGETHTWHDVAAQNDIEFRLKRMADWFDAKYVTFRGELIGSKIQGNIYGIPGHQVLLFDIEIDGKPLGAVEYAQWIDRMDLPHTPMLCFGMTLREWLDGQSIVEISNGHSLITGAEKLVLREGIVIKPIVEQFNHSVGRLAFKIKSPEYLAAH